jgi:hypothetical protein
MAIYSPTNFIWLSREQPKWKIFVQSGYSDYNIQQPKKCYNKRTGVIETIQFTLLPCYRLLYIAVCTHGYDEIYNASSLGNRLSIALEYPWQYKIAQQGGTGIISQGMTF